MARRVTPYKSSTNQSEPTQNPRRQHIRRTPRQHQHQDGVPVYKGMMGLGDNIYQRAFIKQLSSERVFLETPWPEIYKDLDHVMPIRPYTKYRTQQKNEQRHSSKTWVDPPARKKDIIVKHGKDRQGNYPGIIQGFINTFNLTPAKMDLPEFSPCPVEGKYVIIRPVTVRSEWKTESRNPYPQYVCEAAQVMIDRGYDVVSVADLSPDAEWIIGKAPPTTIRYDHGELEVEQLLALVQNACAVIGGIGWIVPAGIATGVPTWVICGGQGTLNSPEKITSNYFNSEHVRFAVPDNFCYCQMANHNCDKIITKHKEKFEQWFDLTVNK